MARPNEPIEKVLWRFADRVIQRLANELASVPVDDAYEAVVAKIRSLDEDDKIAMNDWVAHELIVRAAIVRRRNERRTKGLDEADYDPTTGRFVPALERE